MRALKERLRRLTGVMNADEWTVCAAAAAVLLPEKATAAALLLLLLSAVVRRAGRESLLRRMGDRRFLPQTAALMLLLPLLVVPAVREGYLYGVLAGTGIWLILVFAVYASSVMTVRLYSNLLDLMLAVSVVAAAVGVFCQFAGILELGRVASIYENPNYYGYVIELMVLASLCQYMRRRSPVYLLLTALNLVCNVLCDCRTAWAAILVSVTVFFLMYFRQLWLLAVAAGAGGFFVIAARFVPSIGERLTLEAIRRSLANRERYWANAWRWFRESPVFGRGAVSYQLLSEREGERVLAHAHNMYLNILLDVGIIGAVLTVVLLAVQLRGVGRKQPSGKPDSFGCLIVSALTATAVHGLTDMTVLGVSTAITFMLILAGAGIEPEEQTPPETRCEVPPDAH